MKSNEIWSTNDMKGFIYIEISNPMKNLDLQDENEFNQWEALIFIGQNEFNQWEDGIRHENSQWQWSK